ncbi:hypothetical protein Gohar_006733 [Gossypium harknessii]|uniref:RNase H type-1 domain-containing protein n=1 Tax=Gossypium harknessii TaxID=34285 RepID=A0A7J9GEB5_9ROSI|nr:hypothetical protein [Gossypium harknessii]
MRGSLWYFGMGGGSVGGNAWNRRGHKNVLIQMHILIQKVDTYLLELDVAQVKLLGHPIGAERWQPPDGCRLKINFDATFHSTFRTSCARVVIRNSHWTVLALHMVVCKHTPSIFAVEAITCLRAVHLGMALDFPDVIVEDDSLMVLHKVQSSWFDLSILDAYIRDIEHWAGYFCRCDFRHFLRAGNTVADLLAKEGLKEGMGSYMCGVFPILHNGRWSVIISPICKAFNGKWRGGGEHFS